MTPKSSQKFSWFEIIRLLKTWRILGGNKHWVVSNLKVGLGLHRVISKSELGLGLELLLIIAEYHPRWVKGTIELGLGLDLPRFLLTLFLTGILQCVDSNPNPTFWFLLTQSLWPPNDLKSFHDMRLSDYWKLGEYLGVINIESFQI